MQPITDTWQEFPLEINGAKVWRRVHKDIVYLQVAKAISGWEYVLSPLRATNMRLQDVVETLEYAKIKADEQAEAVFNDKIGAMEHALECLGGYVKVLKGESQDLTGLGLWRIFCDALEAANDCKIITKGQWEAFTKDTPQ